MACHIRRGASLHSRYQPDIRGDASQPLARSFSRRHPLGSLGTLPSGTKNPTSTFAPIARRCEG